MRHGKSLSVEDGTGFRGKLKQTEMQWIFGQNRRSCCARLAEINLVGWFGVDSALE